MASMPLMFGAAIAGLVVLDYGFQAARQAFSGSGSSAGVTSAALAGKGVNPMGKATGLVWERTDQGVDASMDPGSPILAPFDSEYMGTVSDWYAGQPYIAFKILDGPYQNDIYYLAEQINPVNFTQGQQLGAGTTIATYASSGTGIEFGLANPADWSQTLAQATTGYTEGEQTQAGMMWRAILNALGAGAGPNT